MESFIYSLAVATSLVTQPMALAGPKTLLTCSAESSEQNATGIEKITFVESDLKGRLEVALTRTDGTVEYSGVSEADFGTESSENASTELSLAEGRARVLKRTGAYTNLEVFSISRFDGKVSLTAGRSCDAYYQEEEGCYFTGTVLDERTVALDCK